MLGVSGLLIAFVLMQRRELEIRVALGARPRHIVSTVLNQVFFWVIGGTLVGLVIGAYLTLWAATMAAMHLPNPWSLAAIVSIPIIGMTAIALWIPIRNARHLGPARLLRTD